MRGAVYVDGFNLYHAINDLGKPHLKWLDLRRLGELIARGHAKTIEKAVFCTAYFPGDFGKKVRHEAYVNALENRDVVVRKGHTSNEPNECKSCGRKWEAPREKATDINLALAAYEDALDNVYDAAFIVTADTDQVATFEAIRRRWPEKQLFAVTPPGRFPSSHLKRFANGGSIKLTEDHIDLCALPHLVEKAGQRTIIRPREYDPPAGWVHPDNRPK